MTTNLLLPIVLLPLVGFLINGLLGNRSAKRFVSVVGLRPADRRLRYRDLRDDAATVAPAGRWCRPCSRGHSLPTARSRSRFTSTGWPR